MIFSIKLSIKGNNGNLITPRLSYSLNEAKEQCAKSLEKKNIIC